ncbi:MULTISPECIES: HD domain-containing protein [Megasphaera]|uniref:HD domain protein n=1 Tax=Megasphaera vaginalis (ex Srinivasan et al. 2021) TaxID=1111454 RepID=U7UC82_9FIRM|nr:MULTISPECIES: HD domain-containing protein [Megasphaera]ERT56926.1 HD domain protein [Megasphaera vaginalis (ex Srinivasan et al. 2021)]
MDTALLLKKVIAYDRGDARRIQHLLKVYAYADLLASLEGIDGRTKEILNTAAILHDIGIHQAEKQYGSAAGKFQEKTGPVEARKILTSLTDDAALIDRVCFLIGHHHTYTGVNGIDWQLLLEADFLVNAYEDGLTATGIMAAAERFFKSKSGLALLQDTFAI